MTLRIAPLASLLAVVLAAIGFTGSAQARTKTPPRITALRCLPVTTAACKAGVRVAVGKQILLRGRGLTTGMHVAFRWSKGALSTKLTHTKAGYGTRVPAGNSSSTGSSSLTSPWVGHVGLRTKQLCWFQR